MPYSVTGVFYTENCSSLVGWNDGDDGDGATTQEDNAPGADPATNTFKFDSGGAGAGNKASINDATGEDFEIVRLVIEMRLYIDVGGTEGNLDRFSIQLSRSDWRLGASFATDSLYIRDTSGFQAIGNWVAEDGWQTWIFDIDFSGGVGSATCAIYMNDGLNASGVDCDAEGSLTNGQIFLTQLGNTSANRIAYLDYIKTGTGLSFAAAETLPSNAQLLNSGGMIGSVYV